VRKEMIRRLGIEVVAAGALVAFSLVTGGVAQASKCDSGITKAEGKKVACKTSVNGGAQSKGTTPDSTKLQKCTDKFTKSCNKAVTAGDCTAAQNTNCNADEAEADACVNTLSGGAATAGKCDGPITKAAGKKVSCKAGVIAKAQSKGGSPDAAKLAKCSASFDKACQKAKGSGDTCTAHPESCATTEGSADTCVGQVSSSPSGAFLE